MATLDPDMGELVTEAMEGIGIDVRTGAAGHRPRADATAGCRAVVTAERPSPGRPGRPRPRRTPEHRARRRPPGCRWARTGGIRVDRRMRVHGVHGRLGGRRLRGDPPPGHRASRCTCRWAPTPTSRAGSPGINIGGGYATFPGVVGTAVTKVCDLEVARTGLREQDAAAAGFEFVTGDRRVDQPGRLLPGRPADDGQADRRAAHRAAARRADRRPVRGGQADRRARGGAVERHDGRGDDRPRPGLRAAVLAGLGPGADRRPQGRRRPGRRRPLCRRRRALPVAQATGRAPSLRAACRGWGSSVCPLAPHRSRQAGR